MKRLSRASSSQIFSKNFSWCRQKQVFGALMPETSIIIYFHPKFEITSQPMWTKWPSGDFRDRLTLQFCIFHQDIPWNFGIHLMELLHYITTDRQRNTIYGRDSFQLATVWIIISLECVLGVACRCYSDLNIMLLPD